MSSISDALGSLPPQFVVTTTTVQPAVAGQEKQLCAANPLRWGLIIAAPLTSSSGQVEPSWVAPAHGVVTTNSGIALSSGQPPLSLTFRDLGILVQQPWYGAVVGTGGTTNWVVIEVLIQQ